jgi:hypothetical protein
MNKQIEAMKKLGMSDAEIAELLKADKEIDQGKNLFPLTKDQEKVSKEARSVGREPTIYKLDNTEGKRSKKSDGDKTFLLSMLMGGVAKEIDNLEIANVEREFSFTFNGSKYKVVLSKPRS